MPPLTRKKISPLNNFHPEKAFTQINGLYIHSNPPRVLPVNSNQIRNWLRVGDFDKLDQAILDGKGAKLLGEYSPDPKVRTYLKTLPSFMSKIELAHDAVSGNSLAELQQLLQEDGGKRKLASCKDQAGVGLLHKAVYYDLPEITNYLLNNYPYLVYLKDREGRTPCHYSASCKDPQAMLRRLEHAGGDVTAVDARNNTPQYYIKNPGELELPQPTKAMAQLGAMVKKIKNDNDGLVIKPSNIRIWIHQRDLSKLQHVLWEGHGNKLRTEISNNPKVKRFLEAVPHLMGLIRDIHNTAISNDLTTLEQKIEEPVMPIILSSKDSNGLTAFHKAVGLGHKEVAEFILEKYPKILSSCDNEGRTALHYAAILKDDNDMYNFLVKSGADVAKLDYRQKTAGFYRNRPMDIDSKLLTVAPDAPRTANNQFPANWDWGLLLAAGSTANQSLRKSTETIATSTSNNHIEEPESDGDSLDAIQKSEEKTEIEVEEENQTDENIKAIDVEIVNNSPDPQEIVIDEINENNFNTNDDIVELSTTDNKEEIGKEDYLGNLENNIDIQEESNIENQEDKVDSAERSDDIQNSESNLVKAKDGEEEYIPNAVSPDILDVQHEQEIMQQRFNGYESQEENDIVDVVEEEKKDEDTVEETRVEPDSEMKEITNEEEEEEAIQSYQNEKLIEDVNGEEFYATGEVKEEDDDRKSGNSERIIEGLVKYDEEKLNEDGQDLDYEENVELDTEVTEMVESGNMEQLAALVLGGNGKRLVGQHSANPELQAFLDNVPSYMNKIGRVHIAAREGNLRDLQAALDRRKFAIAKDHVSPNGASPLHVATIFGNTSIVRYLAGRFPETVQITDDNGRTPLHYAATIEDNGHYYNLLLHLGANAKLQDNFGHMAEYYRNNTQEFNHKTLLQDFGATDMLESSEVLADQETPENQVDRLFRTEEGRYLAMSLGDPLIRGLTEIANKRPQDPIAYLATYLHNFAHERTSSEMNTDQNNDEGASSREANPIVTNQNDINSIEHHNEPPPRTIDVVTLDPNDIPRTPDITKSAFSSPNRDEHGQSMLHFAVARSHGRNGLFQIMEENNINIGYRDEIYRTARDVSIQANIPENTTEIDRWVIHIAARGDIDKLVELLLEGYDHLVDAMDENNKNILEIIQDRSQPAIVAFLQSVMAFEEKRERVHHAIRLGDLDLVRELLSDENETGSGNLLAIGKNNYGRCSLHVAVLCQREEIADYISNTFPDTLKIGDNLERTALHYAMGIEKVESMSKVLIKAGATRVLKDLKGRQATYYFMNKSDILRLQEEEETF